MLRWAGSSTLLAIPEPDDIAPGAASDREPPASDASELSTVPKHTPVDGLTVSAGVAQVDMLVRELAIRDQFIAAIGHELRNAVAPLVLLAEQFTMLDQQNNLPPIVAKRIPVLDRNLRKFVSTVERVTQVAHLRQDKVVLEPVTLDLAHAIRDAEQALHDEAAASGATITIDVDGDVTGRWDRARIEQILHHLLSNAIRYAGGGAIEIRARGDRSTVYLTVRDHGPGLGGDLATVFHRFEHASSRHGGGFGVGLFVVYRSCALLGGSVSAENADGGGARFSVMLPRG